MGANVKGRLKDILEKEQILKSTKKHGKAAHNAFKKRSFVPLKDSLYNIEDSFDFSDEDIGRLFSIAMIKSNDYWLSRFPQDVTGHEYKSRKMKKGFQEHVRSEIVLYNHDMFWENKTKEDILSLVDTDELIEVDPRNEDPFELNHGTIEYAVINHLNTARDFGTLGKSVKKGAQRYVSDVRPISGKEHLFIEYKRIEEEITKQ